MLIFTKINSYKIYIHFKGCYNLGSCDLGRSFLIWAKNFGSYYTMYKDNGKMENTNLNNNFEEKTDNNLLQDNKEVIQANNFANYNNIVISKMEENYAEAYIDVVADSLNSYGGVHGGAFFTLADTCAAFAARGDGRMYVTQQASSQFMRTVGEGRITAKGEVINRGRSFCIIDVKIYDEKDKLLYQGTFNYFCVSK